MISHYRFSSNIFNTTIILIALFSIPLSGSAAEIGSITPPELLARISSGDAPLILDVRTRQEFSQGHIEGAINIPYTELNGRIGEIKAKKSDELIVYCLSGVRAGIAEKMLVSTGYTQLRDLEGHLIKWTALGYPLK